MEIELVVETTDSLSLEWHNVVYVVPITSQHVQSVRCPVERLYPFGVGPLWGSLKLSSASFRFMSIAFSEICRLPDNLRCFCTFRILLRPLRQHRPKPFRIAPVVANACCVHSLAMTFSILSIALLPMFRVRFAVR